MLDESQCENLNSLAHLCKSLVLAKTAGTKCGTRTNGLPFLHQQKEKFCTANIDALCSSEIKIMFRTWMPSMSILTNCLDTKFSTNHQCDHEYIIAPPPPGSSGSPY